MNFGMEMKLEAIVIRKKDKVDEWLSKSGLMGVCNGMLLILKN